MTPEMEALLKSEMEGAMSGGLDVGIIVCSLIFSMIGWVIFRMGWKSGDATQIFTGSGLMLYTYFMPNWILALIVGCVLTAIPVVLRGRM